MYCKSVQFVNTANIFPVISLAKQAACLRLYTNVWESLYTKLGRTVFSI